MEVFHCRSNFGKIILVNKNTSERLQRRWSFSPSSDNSLFKKSVGSRLIATHEDCEQIVEAGNSRSKNRVKISQYSLALNDCMNLNNICQNIMEET